MQARQRAAINKMGTLFVVATPIGNLGDITSRALETLKQVDLIACEDTRQTVKLLNHFGIQKPLISYHDFNEDKRAEELVRKLAGVTNVALVSDAGTPAISDPGYRIVRICRERAIPVIAIPGPNAAVAALSASGLPSDEFLFMGFLPATKNARRQKLESIANVTSTLVFYEAPHRIAESLRDAREILGEREAVIARELTKLHEEILRGRLSELAQRFSTGEEGARGEMVLMIDRKVIGGASCATGSSEISSFVAALEAESLDARTALKKAAKKLGISRDEAYRRLSAERSREKA